MSMGSKQAPFKPKAVENMKMERWEVQGRKHDWLAPCVSVQGVKSGVFSTLYFAGSSALAAWSHPVTNSHNKNTPLKPVLINIRLRNSYECCLTQGVCTAPKKFLKIRLQKALEIEPKPKNIHSNPVIVLTVILLNISLNPVYTLVNKIMDDLVKS